MRAIATLRSAPVVVSLVLAATLFAPAVAGAARTSTANPVAGHDTTRRALVSANGYATSLFSKIPLPALATPIAKPTTPLQPVSGSLGLAHMADVTRYFTLPSSFDVEGFAKSHFPSSQWQGDSSTTDGGNRVSSSFSILPLCRDRHAAYCGATYTTGSLGAGRQELRVDVAVVWLPVHVVYLPTSGVVTLTGYARISLMNQSSGPVVVTLNASQVKHLRSAIALLRSAPGGMCMEDSLLYRISVASQAGGKVIWSARADECPGEFVVSRPGGNIALNGRSCALDGLVTSFFPGKEARGTKSGLKACQPSL